MGIHLIVEVLDHAPAKLTAVDRLLLVVIAENASDKTREGYPGWELIARRMKWSGHRDGGRHAVTTALAAMAKRGVEVRVPLGTDRFDRPVYAANGHRTTYRIPAFLRVAEIATLKGGNEAHPSGDEGWQSETLKGGNPSTGRVAEIATPSPQEPSENPQAKPVPTPPDFERLPEPLRTIGRSLGEHHPTADEIRAVQRAVIAARKPKTVKYYTAMAADGGFVSFLLDHRRAAAEDRAKRIAEQRRTGPWCEHGEARDAKTSTGQPLCVLCRRGVHQPAQADTETSPGRVEVLTAYRAVMRDAGHTPSTAELVEIAALSRFVDEERSPA